MRKVSFLLLLVSTIFLSCKKNNTGGKADISATVMHHEQIIPFATIYIKYGAKDFPGTNTSGYNASIKTDAKGRADISGLRYGDYYIYGVGFDSTIMVPVSGGDHLQIKWSQRKNTISFTVPVTE